MHVILAWLNDLLSDIVEEIPATIGKRGLKEGQRYLSHRGVLTEFKGHTGPQGIIVTWRRSEEGMCEYNSE